MLYLIAELTIKPGSLETVRAAVAPCLEATRKEPGCISYELFTSIEDETRLVFVERWKSRADLDLHFETPHLIAWREAGSPYITGRRIEVIENGRVELL
ncbi:MAG: antibiotic biosynthesis monooxygenase [Nitratireductor sp.]|nr:antibiotic biosynthesis monooxygenase [Nitratireductor sp.]